MNSNLPRVATNARPGSPEKIRVLSARFAAGRELHHPDDASLRGKSSEMKSGSFRFGDGFEPRTTGGFE
jgi:hypothetical protein